MRWPDTLTRPIGLLKRAPYELRLVYLLKALDSYGYFALSEVFTTYFGEFGVSDITAGTLYGTWGMLITAWGVVTGFAIDAMGVRQSLIACYVLQIFARLVLAFTTNKTSAIVTLFTVQALATSWGAPVMTIAIKRLSVTNEDRVVSFGLFYSTMNVAALLSGLAIDLLRLGAPSDTYGYLGVTTPIRGVVLSTVVSSAFALVVATKFHRVTAHTVRRSQAESFDGKDTTVIAASKKVSSFLQTVKVLSASKSFWQFLTLGLFTVNLKQVFRHLDATFPKFAVRAFGCAAPFGLIYAVNPAMIIVGVPIVASATVRRKHFDMIFFGSWISALAPFLLAFSQTYAGALGFVAVLSLGEMAWSPRWYDYTMACAPDGKEGVFAALALAPLFLAKLPTGVLGGVLLQRFCPGAKGGDCLVTGAEDAEDASGNAAIPAKNTSCDGFAVWGIIGLVTLASPVLIGFFHGWLKDSGVESVGDGNYGTNYEPGTTTDQTWNPSSTNQSPYTRLALGNGDLPTDDTDRSTGSTSVSPYGQTVGDSDDDDKHALELVPLRPEPRRKGEFQ